MGEGLGRYAPQTLPQTPTCFRGKRTASVGRDDLGTPFPAPSAAKRRPMPKLRSRIHSGVSNIP